jgi:hypothetical protein
LSPYVAWIPTYEAPTIKFEYIRDKNNLLNLYQETSFITYFLCHAAPNNGYGLSVTTFLNNLEVAGNRIPMEIRKK